MMTTVPHEDDDGLERLGETDGFNDEVQSLARVAREPWRSRLHAIAWTGKRAA